MPISPVTATRLWLDSSAPTLGRRQLHESYEWDGSTQVKVAFFDADSTLRVALSGKVCPQGPRDVALLPGVAAKLKALAQEGYLIAIVSNQGGVGRKELAIADADAALAYTAQLIRDAGGEVHYYDFAETLGVDRKPGIGMAQRLDTELQEWFGPDVSIDKDASFMCGDASWTDQQTRLDGRTGFNFSDSDRLFAHGFGIRFREPQYMFGWAKYGVDEFENISQLRAFQLRIRQ